MSITQIYEKFKFYAQKVKNWPWWRKFIEYLWQSKRSVLWALPLMIVLYYLVGGWVTNKIEKNPDFKLEKTDNGTASVEIIKDLIKRETQQHMWTPSLPLLFPGYVLDNMPAFQSGLFKTLEHTTRVLAKICPNENLNQAARFLSYPQNLWLFSSTENLMPAPSSVAQYRKAHKALHRFLRENPSCLSEASKVLVPLLRGLRSNLSKTITQIEAEVREKSEQWGDATADTVFYEAQGRIYGAYALLRAISADYSAFLAQNELYANYTSIEKTLSDALLLDPLVIRNGKPESLTVPNHLLNLGYYTGKAMSQITDLILKFQALRENAL